jgi:hypothetical protein
MLGENHFVEQNQHVLPSNFLAWTTYGIIEKHAKQ